MTRVYDKPVIIQRINENGVWADWRRVRAYINTVKDTADSLYFEVRYERRISEIFSKIEEFAIIYRGDVYLIRNYDDFQQRHLTVKLTAEILRLGRLSGKMNVYRKIKTQDADGFTVQTEELMFTVRCYREGRLGGTSEANLTLQTAATDIFQVEAIPGFEFTREYLIEHNGQRFEILDVDAVKGRGFYVEILAKRLESAVR